MPAVRTLELVGLDRFHDDAARARLRHADRARRALRRLAGAGRRRRDAARADQRVPRARQRRRRGADARRRRRRRRADARRVLRRRPRASSSPTSSPTAARARSTFGLDNPLATRVWSAVKTGTSKDMRDNWCIGFTSRYTVGVWVGNFSGAPMRDVSGVTGAAPVWRDLVHFLHRGATRRPRRRRRPASSRTAVRFDPPVERRAREWFVRGTEMARRSRGSATRTAPAPRRASAIRRRTRSSRSIPTFPPGTSAWRSRPRRRSPGLRWRLDDAVLARRARPRAVGAAPGPRTRWRSRTRRAASLSRVAFEVRGDPAADAALPGD